jgi:SAM-dependent methyltransferase
MLTVDFASFPITPGEKLLDVGCGAGRHTFEALKRGAQVIALDQNKDDLATIDSWVAAMESAGEIAKGGSAKTVQGDILKLPYADNYFDKVIAAEILEHIPKDRRAMAEIARVVRPGGLVAVTVPRHWPERICWALSEPYHNTPGGHVRIYRRQEMMAKLRQTGLEVLDYRHVHALHAPYWWLKCAVGVDNDRNVLVKTYHRMLVWDITNRPWPTRAAERVLAPAIGKSLAVYLQKQEQP